MCRHKTEPGVLRLPVAMLGILAITSGIAHGGGNCQSDADCEDGNPCTQDACVGNVCEDTPTSGCLGCPMGSSRNCQVFHDFDYLGLLSDLTVPPYGAVHADDFIPATTEIDTICVWGAYLDANAPDTEPVFTRYNCAGAVEDHFRVRVYADDGGLPGALVAERWVPGEQVTKSEIPDSGFEQVWEIPMQVFTLTFPTISLPLADTTYWLEVANDTGTPTGTPHPIRNTCYWHWAQVVFSETYGNRHGVTGTNDRPGGPPGSGYTELSDRWTGTAFCLSGPSGPVSLSAPDPPVGACCDCDGGCEENRTQAACADFAPWSEKLWTHNAACTLSGLCDYPAGDVCWWDQIPITNGLYGFDTTCTNDKPPPPYPYPPGLGREIWYCYTATCTGEMTASMCASSVYYGGYDSYIAVFHDFNNPYECPCPGFDTRLQVAASDEGCNGIPDSSAGIISGQLVFPGEKWMIGVGGFDYGLGHRPDRGRGFLDIACVECDCFPSSPPQPQRLENLPAQPVSDKNRFLSIKAGDPWIEQLIRVTFVDLPAPFDIWNGRKLFAGEPFEVCDAGGIVSIEECTIGPEIPLPRFWAAPLVCDLADAHRMDWHGACLQGMCRGGLRAGADCSNDDDCQDVVHIFHEGIVPEGVYDIQTLDNTSCGVNYEPCYSWPPLTMTQARWGDVVKNCTTNPCGPPDGVVNVPTDVTAILDKFRNLPGSPIKARCDLAGIPPNDGILNFTIDILDVTHCLGAFIGVLYPFKPSADPCGG